MEMALVVLGRVKAAFTVEVARAVAGRVVAAVGAVTAVVVSLQTEGRHGQNGSGQI